MFIFGHDVCPCCWRKSINGAKRQLFCGGIIAFLGLALIPLAIVGYVLLHDEIDSSVRTVATFDKNDTAEFKTWMDNSENPVLLTVYFYNLTNPADVLNGAKPRLREVGPWVYEDIKKRFDTRWNTNQTVLCYRTFEQFRFRRDLSVSSDMTNISTLNLPFTGLTGNLWGNENGDIDLFIFYNADSDYQKLFVSRSVRDIVFGYWDSTLAFINEVDPSVSPIFPGLIHNMSSPANATTFDCIHTGKLASPENFRAYLRWRDMSVYSICPKPGTPCNSSQLQPAWATTSASMVGGSDGSQIAPNVQAGTSFNLWSTAAFRQVRFTNFRSQQVVYRGITTLRFQMDESAWLNSSQYPPNRVYFQNLPSGLMNISRVAENEQVFLSRAHLQGVGPEVTNRFSMKYTAKLGPEFIDVEPITGSSMHLMQRSQLNIAIRPLSGMPNASGGDPVTWFPNLKPVLLPVVWFGDEAGISHKEAAKLRRQLYGAEFLDESTVFVGVPLGVMIAAIGVTLVLFAHRSLQHIDDDVFESRAALIEKDDFGDVVVVPPPPSTVAGSEENFSFGRFPARSPSPGSEGYGTFSDGESNGNGATPAHHHDRDRDNGLRESDMLPTVPEVGTPEKSSVNDPLSVTGSPRDITVLRSPPDQPSNLGRAVVTIDLDES